MPELPELQALAEGLTGHLAGRTVAGVHEHHPATLKTADPPADALVGRSVERVWRRGKLIGVEVEGGLHLVIHLMQAGRLGMAAAPAKRPGGRTRQRATGRAARSSASAPNSGSVSGGQSDRHLEHRTCVPCQDRIRSRWGCVKESSGAHEGRATPAIDIVALKGTVGPQAIGHDHLTRSKGVQEAHSETIID